MHREDDLDRIINELILNREWLSLIKKVTPEKISNSLEFTESMKLVGVLVEYSESIMIEDNYASDQMREYAVDLMFTLRKKHSILWEKDWKNEAFLGIACMFIYKDEEAFHILKSLYEKMPNPPQSLVLAYIGSGSGKIKWLSASVIEKLLEQATQKGITYEVAWKLASLARDRHNTKNQEYWKSQAHLAEKEHRFTPVIIPDLIKNIGTLKHGRVYED